MRPTLRGKLHYSDDAHPGFGRKRAWFGRFTYLDVNGRKIRDARLLARIRSLAIPPAYTDVWICPSANGHLQFTGRDARGRKQYHYHEKWYEMQNSTKFGRMASFGRALPHIRATVRAHLGLPELSLRKVCAAIVALIDKTHIRIGNDEYAKENHSFGLTTLRKRHVNVDGDTITFRFKGKSSVQHATTLVDPSLSKIIHACQDIPGHELFSFIDHEDVCHDVKSTHVNAYLQTISNNDYTAKDFRTWHGTVLAASLFMDGRPVSSLREAKRRVITVVKEVSKSLGNTPTICRKSYIHPAVISDYLEQWKTMPLKRSPARVTRGLHPYEQHALSFLERVGK